MVASGPSRFRLRASAGVKDVKSRWGVLWEGASGWVYALARGAGIPVLLLGVVLLGEGLLGEALLGEGDGVLV